MIVEYIRYTIAEVDRASFEEAYQRGSLSLAAAPECVDFELSRCEEGPESYILRIRWKSTKAHLEGFRKGPHFSEFLAAIGPYVTSIDEMRHYKPTKVVGKGGAVPSLFEWAGGAQAFEELFTVFYKRVSDDDILAPVFASMDENHPKHVAAWLGEVFGGPKRYSTEHGGHEHMVGRHLGRGITEEQRRRWVQLLTDTADVVGMPEDPEFRAVFVYYLEWGTRMARLYSGPNPPPAMKAPMPRWDWALTPPYVPGKS
ncbi:MAG: antibiotic biosynthesis monooxygenase [Corynebacteriales bacterium]|nr:antibiotic biosynthesis monooxygenase [Mycobacteriales bacterium]